ncbi:MAG TPA: DegV family protein [Acidimicrobiia bacterium]|nr:DegV family protein [Acidimicrobiia bacterium]
MPIRIVTDSACDVPEALCAELGIEVVPLTIRFGEEEFVDRKELSTEEFWRRVESSTVLPETAAPSVGAFEEVFRRLADEGADGIVCVNLSSELSATIQSAQLAAKALDGVCPVEIVDSRSASVGIGHLALHAARRAREGADLATIVAELEDRRDRSRLLGALDTLEYLQRGGRIGGAQAFLGSLLSIKPVITVRDGIVDKAGQVRTRSKALRYIVDQIPAGRVESLAVLHAQADDVDEFVAMLREKIGDVPIDVGTIGPVVGVHAGPRTLGAVWVERAS